MPRHDLSAILESLKSEVIEAEVEDEDGGSQLVPFVVRTGIIYKNKCYICIVPQELNDPDSGLYAILEYRPDDSEEPYAHVKSEADFDHLMQTFETMLESDETEPAEGINGTWD